MRHLIITALTVALAGGVTGALAQHADHAHHAAGLAQAADARMLVKFPEPLVEHTLTNMRDHLLALQEIQEHLGMGHADVAAQIAENRLGMSSLQLHGAHDVAQHMPAGMQEAGEAMHRAASQFAITAANAGVTNDMKPVFSALAKVTSACVACHAAYRIR
ncbi:MAG: cytochrome c [Hyphomicrobiales bacterium]|nr:cytochrome c [Hyphomicrobiales bacterium]